MSVLPPGLYLVATPIGNLADITQRAARILAQVDHIACEDSRITRRLLQALGISKPLIAYHDHSDDETQNRILALMADGAVALVSDAGTPLISDPGYRLVRAARAAGHAITTLPGPCAAIAAITLAGLPSDRFLFAGFLPAKAKARSDALAELADIRATLVFYESGPRLAASLAAMAAVLGPAREAAVARELTKIYEECRTGTLAALAAQYADAGAPKGEIVVLVGPPVADDAPADPGTLAALLADALETMPPARAAKHVAQATGADRAALYAQAVAMKQQA